MTCRGQEHLGVFPPDIRAEASALACSLRQAQAVCLSRWSLGAIAERLVVSKRVTGIAPSTLCRWFAADRLKPWRYHYWQHILDPQGFLERARPVLQLYEQAQALLQAGVWVVCADEKTSIQAREHEQVLQAATAGHPWRLSPRYKRRGALHLFAALSVADGVKLGQTFQRKRFVDFQTFLLDSLSPKPCGAAFIPSSSFWITGLPTPLNNSLVGCTSNARLIIGPSPSRSIGCHPMPPGLTRLRSGSAFFSASCYSPTISIAWRN